MNNDNLTSIELQCKLCNKWISTIAEQVKIVCLECELDHLEKEGN